MVVIILTIHTWIEDGNDESASLNDICVENQDLELNFYFYLEELPGDMNTDGNIDILDILLVVGIILDFEYSSDADFNDDGNVDILDVIMLINWILN